MRYLQDIKTNKGYNLYMNKLNNNTQHETNLYNQANVLLAGRYYYSSKRQPMNLQPRACLLQEYSKIPKHIKQLADYYCTSDRYRHEKAANH